jgi:hypothetical protein
MNPAPPFLARCPTGHSYIHRSTPILLLAPWLEQHPSWNHLQNYGGEYSVYPCNEGRYGPANTGDNPKVGVPVHLHRPHFTFFGPLPPCVPCLPSSPPFPPQTPPTPSPASSSAKQCILPHESTRARPAILATLLLKQAEGSLLCPQEDTCSRPREVSLSEQSEGHAPHPYEDTRASSARKIIASQLLAQSEGNKSRVREVPTYVSLLFHHPPLSVTWSSPPVTMYIEPSIFAFPLPRTTKSHNNSSS